MAAHNVVNLQGPNLQVPLPFYSSSLLLCAETAYIMTCASGILVIVSMQKMDRTQPFASPTGDVADEVWESVCIQCDAHNMGMFYAMGNKADRILITLDSRVTSFSMIVPCHMDIISLACVLSSHQFICFLCTVVMWLSATHAVDRQLVRTECINDFPCKS